MTKTSAATPICKTLPTLFNDHGSAHSDVAGGQRYFTLAKDARLTPGGPSSVAQKKGKKMYVFHQYSTAVVL